MPAEPKLFAVYVGGAAPRAHIEVHDMRFVVGIKIGDTYDELRRQWWGTPDSLHLDGWATLDHADGFDIALTREPNDSKEKLYFAYMGGTQAGEFIELHKNLFLVAGSAAAAKARALAAVAGWDGAHRDNLYDLDALLCLDEMLAPQGLHIRLTPATPRPLTFTCRYIKIGRTEAAPQ